MYMLHNTYIHTYIHTYNHECMHTTAFVEINTDAPDKCVKSPARGSQSPGGGLGYRSLEVSLSRECHIAEHDEAGPTWLGNLGTEVSIGHSYGKLVHV